MREQPLYVSSLDIVEELRLRRWARQNYVPLQMRDNNWHPVVHEEMQRKDAELIIGSRTREPIPAYVPLVPLPPFHYHTRHDLPEEPKLLQTTAQGEKVSVDESTAATRQ